VKEIGGDDDHINTRLALPIQKRRIKVPTRNSSLSGDQRWHFSRLYSPSDGISDLLGPIALTLS
jgi:hypothetical protein